jgi:hypothetical protein
LGAISVWRSIAIVIKASTFSTETEVDALVTNAVTDKATAQWIVTNYSQRKRPNNVGGGYIQQIPCL